MSAAEPVRLSDITRNVADDLALNANPPLSVASSSPSRRGAVLQRGEHEGVPEACEAFVGGQLHRRQVTARRHEGHGPRALIRALVGRARPRHLVESSQEARIVGLPKATATQATSETAA